MAFPHEREILAWRAARVERLKGPDGWLSVVGLFWLDEGESSVGSDPSCRVRLPAKAPDRVGAIRMNADRASFHAEPGSAVTHQGREVATLDLRDDHQGEPTILELGNIRFHLIRRYDRLAGRVRDRDSPARASFRGIEYYPIDPRWLIEARFEPHEPPRISKVPTVLSMEETYDTPGALAFRLGSETHRLEAFLEPEEWDLFIVFGDLTNQHDTYGGGRHLYTAPPDDRGVVVLDFNKAYNPPCVFTPHATGALPLPQNRLPIRVTAGEKRYTSGT